MTTEKHIDGYGVVVGRFQCDELTAGHLALINHVCDLHNGRILIVVGIARTPPNATNSLSYEIREWMIQQEYPFALVVGLRDERSNEVWSKKLDELIRQVIKEDQLDNVDIHLYSGRDGFIPWYSGIYPTQELNFNIECSATERRNDIGSDSFRDNMMGSAEFRQGIIYAHQTRIHQTYETVDVALLSHSGDGHLRILLGQKSNETAWRFPGGFIDGDKHESIIEAAARELREETGLDTVSGIELVGDYLLLNEWRIQRQKNVSHRTFLTMGWYGWGTPHASDDLAAVSWFDLPEVFNKPEIMMEEHRLNMLDGLKQYLQRRYPQFLPVEAV